jgi:hypothetical protein
MEFVESGLHFYFDRSWIVKKYDAHRFFPGLAGAGLKGVDFIAIKRGKLMMIEIKNFRRRQSWQTENPLEDILQDPDQFAETITRKAEDTLRGIGAIGTYYQRKWFYRLSNSVLKFLPTNGWDFLFWIRAHRLAQLPEQVQFVLWMETEQARPELKASIHQKLNEWLSPSIHTVLLTSCEDQSLPQTIWVEPIKE